MNHSFQNTELYTSITPPTIFLPGWGFDGRILRLLKPSPAWIYPDTPLDPETIEQDLLRLLEVKNSKKIRLVGWSMGAMLGLEFAARHKDMIESLVLVSLRKQWPGHETKEIRTEFSQTPEIFLKGFYRKCFLGDKRAYRNFCTTLASLYLTDMKKASERLLRGLDYLDTFTIPVRLPNIPTTLMHGKQDIIAPLKEMPGLPGADVEAINNAGHVVFLHKDSFLRQEAQKQIIQEKFSRAADSYDSYAKVQTEVARSLTAKLPPAGEKPEIKTILEIGCGTGNFTTQLAARFPAAKIVALDFSREMLNKARQKMGSNAIDFSCTEGERFLAETASESFDLVTSNGSLQWFFNIDKTLYNIARILTPGGSMTCSIFGPESLNELGQGLKAVLSPMESLAAQNFPQREKLQRSLEANFLEGTVEEALIEKKYQSAHDLLLHIKKTGTSGWQQHMQQPLTPARINKLDAWFKKTYGACRVTYQVFFLQGSN